MRVVDRIGWTGSCLAFSRAEYATARQRPELSRTGCYLLLGLDAEAGRSERLYIGEADEVRSRLDQHQREKEFWTHGFVLSTKDDSLNKAHVRYLEARLLEQARAAGVAVIDNGTAPPRPRLSESEVADMEAYLANVLVLLPLVGVSAFEVAEQSTQFPAEPAAPGLAPPAGQGLLYTLTAPFTQALGRDEARGFVVEEGALARRETKVMIKAYSDLRSRLVSEGVLVDQDEYHLRLIRKYVFDSPSSAASVLSGGSKNGRIVWKDERGRTLKQVQEATVA